MWQTEISATNAKTRRLLRDSLNDLNGWNGLNDWNPWTV
jgi:hypothetical protein